MSAKHAKPSKNSEYDVDCKHRSILLCVGKSWNIKIKLNNDQFLLK